MMTMSKERVAYGLKAEALAALADLSTNWNCDVAGAVVYQCEWCHMFHIDFEEVVGRRKPVVAVQMAVATQPAPKIKRE
jgi:hypothetical protein